MELKHLELDPEHGGDSLTAALPRAVDARGFEVFTVVVEDVQQSGAETSPPT